MPVQSNVCSRGSPYLILEQVFDIPPRPDRAGYDGYPRSCQQSCALLVGAKKSIRQRAIRPVSPFPY